MIRTQNGNKYFTKEEMKKNDITDFISECDGYKRTKDFIIWDSEINHIRFRNAIDNNIIFCPYIPLPEHAMSLNDIFGEN